MSKVILYNELDLKSFVDKESFEANISQKYFYNKITFVNS